MGAKPSKTKTQKSDLDESLKMKKEKQINNLNESKKKIVSLKPSMMTAITNRELNLRGYQNEIAPVTDFLEVQTSEAIRDVRYEDVLFQQASTIFKLEPLFGDVK